MQPPTKKPVTKGHGTRPPYAPMGDRKAKIMVAYTTQNSISLSNTSGVPYMSRVVIAVTVPPELAEKLDAVAESEYRSRSSLASQLIAQGGVRFLVVFFSKR